MIYNISLGPIGADECLVCKTLKGKKVLDLGGVQRPWARPFVTHYVDLIAPETWAKRYPEMHGYEGFWDKKFMKGNIEDESTWEQLHAEAPFDFVISTQMIEHLSNPKLFLERLPSLAREGFISIPHKRYELKKGIHWGYAFRGALPHRWICIVRDGALRLYPKLNFIEVMDFDWVDNATEIPDLSFWWRDNIPCQVTDDSSLDFSDPKEAIDFYYEELGDKEGEILP